jgi:cephalosporin-C deacetylase
MITPSRFIAFIALLLIASPICPAQSIAFTPDKPSGIYAVGEKVGWTVSLPPGTTPSGQYTYTVRKNNLDVIQSGALDFSSGHARIEVTVSEPAMLYVQITPPASAPPVPRDHPIAAGAAVSPEKLDPSILRPADFDDFWNSKISLLNSIPANPVLTPKDSGRPDIEYDIITMDTINGGHIHGQFAKPSHDGKFPALAIFQWASPPYPLQRPWVTDRAAQGWLTLDIEPHDVLPDQPRAYYQALPDSLKNYQAIGRDDREKCYFLQMYLADYRAVDYLASRPDWDGKTLIVMGTSMGGQQSLCVAGLNPKITGLVVNEPSGCDTNGPLHGRASGYPNWPSNDPKIMQTALYFDPVNFASHITAPSMVAMGFTDLSAPPVGIWTTFNQIPAPKEAVPMVDSPHNYLATPAQQKPFTVRSARWLDSLVHTGQITPNPQFNQASADSHDGIVAVERTDKNSHLAHQQLLEKAKKGRIDIYFEGDSITRRWGASDAMYKNNLANWNQNFFGWNAADFGWGADRIQNILWRLQNGELDNVNPKIIVLLAGTNNIGNATPRADDSRRIAAITHGIQEILTICRQKAPNATIVLMGITPRNDNMAVLPTINQINDNLSHLADGKTIRFVNINDKLADPDGKLYDGMVNPADHLHLALKGYQVWADALKPIFTEILGPPASTDLAPPPTGDPSALIKSHG